MLKALSYDPHAERFWGPSLIQNEKLASSVTVVRGTTLLGVPRPQVSCDPCTCCVVWSRAFLKQFLPLQSRFCILIKNDAEDW